LIDLDHYIIQIVSAWVAASLDFIACTLHPSLMGQKNGFAGIFVEPGQRHFIRGNDTPWLSRWLGNSYSERGDGAWAM